MDDPFPEGMMADIDRFFRDVDPTLPPGLDLYPAVFDTGLFFPLQRQGELAEMMKIARRVEPVTVMEIGADKGGGLYHWCKCLPTVRRVIACEVRGLPYAALFEKAFPRINFLWLPRSSYDPGTVQLVRDFLDGVGAINCLFIDGDKDAFLRDFNTYILLMAEDGVVFMHDINEDHRRGGPLDSFNAAREQGYNSKRIIIKDDTYRAQALARKGVRAATAHEAWLRQWDGRSCGVGVIYL